MEGGIGGVQLLVPEDRINEALKVLKGLEERGEDLDCSEFPTCRLACRSH